MRYVQSALHVVLIAIVAVMIYGLGNVAQADTPPLDIARPAAWSETAAAMQPTAPPTKITELSPELKGKILEAMRMNRRAFQEAAVLSRYGEERPPADHPVFQKCDLPRTSTGAPASQYPASQARATEHAYSEAAVIDCLETTGGLAGTRAKPLTQHYYCSLPGLSPDIRACFTFQLRLPRVSRKRDILDEQGFMPDGKQMELLKGWNFLGPDPSKVPDIPTAFNYCATDGRPHTIKGRGGNLDVAKIHPTPTRPMCWVVESQLDLFQGIMAGLIDPPVKDQVALLQEYYQCDTIKGKVSARRFKAMCQPDVREFQ
jgi:hypothetical protein